MGKHPVQQHPPGLLARQIDPYTWQTVLNPWRLPSAQVVQEVFCWSRNPMEVRRLCARKEEIYRDLLGDSLPVVPPGTRSLLDTLSKQNVRARSPLQS
jgi:hypothetical protein